MALVTDKPEGLSSGNDLDDIPDDPTTPAAYLSFGQTPYALDNPPAIGEKRTYVVRVECTGESESVRNDGEHRYGRKLNILWAVGEGQPKPPDPSDEQPGLFDDDGDQDDETDVDDEE
ncbi:hypothetical protein MSP7336_01826 [Mycobacterium shimoidei]|uniref:Uncharacterized protein n=1 Tax=Mycobacterium shimoidei TaxID=29313 RepID=A0A375YXK5_MYCSH|nr:hypothetical protein [Mycobacterium shimoidei]SRX93587.1 hypothetical protein MSP7336_01826 [Mycobacterium shimoidei]